MSEPDGVRLIVGLGNPGREYAHSRHNVGFWCLNRLARRHGIAFSSRGRLAAVGEGRLAERPVILAKPRTFVNLSGRAVSRPAPALPPLAAATPGGLRRPGPAPGPRPGACQG